MIVLTDEAVQQIEDVLWTLEQHNKLYYGETHNTVIEANKALAIICAARAQEQAGRDPVAWRIVSEDGVKLSDWIDGAPSEGQERWETVHGNAVQRAYAASVEPVKQELVAKDEELNLVLNWMADNAPSYVFETVRNSLHDQRDQILELDRICNETYVAMGADAYNHACDEMEAWQEKRRVRGQEVGTTGSLCDGIAWLYERIEHFEEAPVRTKDLTVLRTRNWTREMSDAWHQAIPNLEKAFDDLIAAYNKGKNGT